MSFLEQRPAHALDDVALDLIFHAVGIDDQAAVLGQRDSLHGDLAAGPVDLDLRYGGSHGFAAVGDGNTSATRFGAAGRRRRRRARVPLALASPLH